MSDEATSGTSIHVLVAVHDEHRAQMVSTFLRNRGHQVACVRDGRAALHALRDEAFDVAVLDIGTHEGDGLELVHQLRATAEPPELIVITGNESGETAIGALRLGAYAHVPKPYRMAEVDVLVQRAWEKRQLARENRYLRDRLARLDGDPAVLTHSPPMQAILALVQRVAASASPVLIAGERGTGKRLLARHLHRVSQRRGQFVELPPGDVGAAGVDVELFGGVGGQDTSAPAARPLGLLELAAHGTLFVPEIAALPLKVQARLARALEHGSFVRTGRTQRIDVTARLIASAAKDLDSALRDKRLHEGLLTYIRAITVTIPPLRDRPADVPLLARHFLRAFGGARSPTLSPEAVARLQSYRWPGNVRELRNVMERLVLTGADAGREIGPDDVPLPIDRETIRTAVGADVTVGELERQHIEAVLERTAWHQGKAAVMLGISPSTLYRKMRELRLEKPAKSRSPRNQEGVRRLRR